MKSSLDKLRRFALHKNDGKDKRDSSSAHLDELAQAAQDMQDMRDCYDSLLSAAAVAANSAYEFSEALREMGSCLLEKTALHDDEESGRVLSMLGKLQFELQKLVDRYRSHILITITNPSESLLNELRTVEDMKRQCDEKRNLYEYMMAQQKEKRKSKSGKGENFTLQQMQTAHDACNDEAILCVFRLKSLKQGQSRSLLTQAARHHAAQLNFFRKGLKSLEAIEPHVRMVTEKQHIDYQFSGLEDDGEDGEDEGENGYDTNEDRELSFDYSINKQRVDFSMSRNSMEVDDTRLSFSRTSAVENAEMNPDKNEGELQVSSREQHKAGSHSAPLFPERRLDLAEKCRQLQVSTKRSSNTYVLPMPTYPKGSVSQKTGGSAPKAMPTNPTGGTHQLWHSSPLEQKKHEKDSVDGRSAEIFLKANSVLKESNSTNLSSQLPPPLAEGLPIPHLDTSNASDMKKIKRQAFSGPLVNKPSSVKPVSATSAPNASTEIPQLVSGVLSRLPRPQPLSSPKVSPSASPPLVSSPRISELHELPRPPRNVVVKPAKSPGLMGHSAPLVSRNQDSSATSRIPSVSSSAASPLPVPPLIVSRSFSIPSSNQRAMALHVSKFLESPQASNKAEEVGSPPLTPMSLANMKPLPTLSEVTAHSGQSRGD